MSKYQTVKSSDDSLAQAALAVVTGGASLLFSTETNHSVTVRDNTSGNSSTGHGTSYSAAKTDAIKSLRKGK
jgi:hypothetical protein